MALPHHFHVCLVALTSADRGVVGEGGATHAVISVSAARAQKERHKQHKCPCV